MGRIFGTDGVRGIANKTLDCELVMALTRASATIKKMQKGAKPLYIVGKDTRLSSTMLESAAAAGLTSVGADVLLLGVVPTPAVAYLTKKMGADAGVMLTASHNPFEYNGIKFFGPDGFKLTDEEEDEIEDIILDRPETISFASSDEIGVVRDAHDAAQAYVDHISDSIGSLEGLKIAVDCANGSASATAKRIFSGKGAEVTYINCEPDGLNVNRHCGSLHIDGLGAFVRENGFDAGFAFDGDADRCLAVDEKGELIDGDMIIAMLADRLKAEGRLAQNTFVVTVMSNVGLFKFGEKNGFRCFTTKVGDRYVLEAMLREGFVLGGEQSGHTIFLDRMTTGDGQLTAMLVAETLKLSGKTASELKSMMTPYPQVMRNIDATPAMKARLSDPEVKSFIDIETERLDGDGRILVRPSGTEPFVRVMIEGRDEKLINELVSECADTLSMMLK